MITLTILSILTLIYYIHKGIVGAKKRNYAKYGFVYHKENWLSIKPVNKCLFNRRNGYIGKIFLWWSIRLRINNKDVI